MAFAFYDGQIAQNFGSRGTAGTGCLAVIAAQLVHSSQNAVTITSKNYFKYGVICSFPKVYDPTKKQSALNPRRSRVVYGGILYEKE
jgi:hypothetical protein